MGFHCSFGHLKHKLWPKEGPGVEFPGVCHFDSRSLKVKNRPKILGCRERATYRWKALDESYNFSLEHASIQGLFAKLWGFKVSGVLHGDISGLPRESTGKNSHLDVASAEWRRVYYKGGRWWLPPSSGRGESCVFVLPVTCPCTKCALTLH